MQKIAVVGTGYVGLITAACFADVGHDVVCIDSDVEKNEALRKNRSPIYEAGLEDLIYKNSDHLRFTTSIPEGLDGREAIFISVGTPMRPDGHADLSFVMRVAADIGHNLPGGTPLIVIKSTVPPGCNAQINAVITENLPHDREFSIAFCPEFCAKVAPSKMCLRLTGS